VASRFESALMGKVGAGGLKKREGPFLAQSTPSVEVRFR
jgi:hypothetical protein